MPRSSASDRRRGARRQQRPRRAVREHHDCGDRDARLRRRPPTHGPQRAAAPARVLLASHRSAAGAAQPRVMSVAHRSAPRRWRPGQRAEVRRRGVIATGHRSGRRGSRPFRRVGAGHVLVSAECTQHLAARTAPAGACPAATPMRADQSPLRSRRGRVPGRRPPGRPSARSRTRCACGPFLERGPPTSGVRVLCGWNGSSVAGDETVREVAVRGLARGLCAKSLRRSGEVALSHDSTRSPASSRRLRTDGCVSLGAPRRTLQWT